MLQVRQVVFVLFWLLLFGLLSPVFAATLADELNITITADQPQYSAKDSITVQFQISAPSTNTAPLKFVPWKTPLEGAFNANMFQVYRGLARVKYIGRVVRRGQPKADQYLSLSPGESFSASIDLELGYQFEQAGTYTVRFDSELMYLHRSDQAVSEATLATAVRSNTITFEISEARVQPRIAAALPAFSGCSASDQTKLSAAQTQATGLTLVARNDLLNTPASQRPTAERYIKWFGVYSAAGYSKASTAFSLMYQAFANETISYFCDCTPLEQSQGIIAYVYSNDHYNIHICDATFSQPVSGSDTQAGTLIHEMSHFTVTVGTSDHGYGEASALNIAVNNSTNALDNAENYLFFAENFPAVAMGTSGGASSNAGSIIPPVMLLLFN